MKKRKRRKRSANFLRTIKGVDGLRRYAATLPKSEEYKRFYGIHPSQRWLVIETPKGYYRVTRGPLARPLPLKRGRIVKSFRLKARARAYARGFER